MSTETCRESDAWTIEYDDDLGAVIHRWKVHTTGDRFREGCEDILAVAEDKNARKLLIDSRAVTALKEDDVGWMFADWVPRSVEAGLEVTATVYPESTIAKMNVEGMAEKIDDLDDGGETHMTTDIDEARSWLAKR